MVAPNIDITAIIINFIIAIIMCSDSTLFSKKGFDHSHFPNEKSISIKIHHEYNQ